MTVVRKDSMNKFEEKYASFKDEFGEYDLSSLNADEMVEAVKLCQEAKDSNIVIKFVQDESEFKEPSTIDLMEQLFGDLGFDGSDKEGL